MAQTTATLVVPVPRKWRAAADAVTAVLGVNLWVSLVFVPGLFVGAFRGNGTAIVLAILPLVVLSLSTATRSQLGLLFFFPSSLLLPLTYDTRLVSSNVHGPITFTIIAVGVLAYLGGVSFLSAFREPPPPDRQKRLSAARPASRWRRRFRMYNALALLSAIFPIALLYAVNFNRRNVAYLRELYPLRFEAISTLLDLGVLALWLALYSMHFLGVLRAHRTGDRPLLHELERLKQETRRATPRPTFYLAVVCALGLMLTLVLLRYR